MKNQTLIFGVGILLLLAGVWLYTASESKEADPINGTSSGLRVGENAIFVADQKPGNAVLVSFADIAQGGFVVIHEVADGKPGTIIGSSALLAKRETANITVNLTRNTLDGEELVAMLHSDNGDGVFSADRDAPVTNESGDIISMRFNVASDPRSLDAATTITF